MSIAEIINQKYWFDYLVGALSAVGSLATAVALWYVVQQSKIARIQQFENNFFQLLNLHNQIASAVTKEENGNLVVKAVVSIKGLFIESRSDGAGGTIPYDTTINDVHHAGEILKERYYERYYKDYEQHFNHYFRNLYHLFKFIYTSKSINWKQKRTMRL